MEKNLIDLISGLEKLGKRKGFGEVIAFPDFIPFPLSECSVLPFFVISSLLLFLLASTTFLSFHHSYLPFLSSFIPFSFYPFPPFPCMLYLLVFFHVLCYLLSILYSFWLVLPYYFDLLLYFSLSFCSFLIVSSPVSYISFFSACFFLLCLSFLVSSPSFV